MIANTDERRFDVIEITNEMPTDRKGGVGTVIDNLMSGFGALGTKAVWFLTDHDYSQSQLNRILQEYSSVVIGSAHDLVKLWAPVVHLHAYNLGPGLVEALQGRRTLFTAHSLLRHEASSNGVDLGRAVREQEELIAASDEVVVTSEAERRHYLELGYQRLNPQVSVVHNGVRKQRYLRPHRRRQVLGFCGRLIPRKRPEYVQMVLGERGFEGYRTLIAGRGFSVYARDLLRSLGVEDRVRYAGWCSSSRLEAFYSSIDVLAVPSTYEPFGMVAVEAAARGIPVVCTAVDGLREALGPFAFYCAPATYDDFRRAMQCWRTAEPDQLAAMTSGAWERHRRSFTDVVMARKYRERFAAVTA